MTTSLKPGIAGLIGSSLAILFFLVFMVLGFFQPGYDHIRNTISALVVGEMGWIQTLNFFVLALSFTCIGFGLGKALTHKSSNHIFALFLTFAICTTILAMIPADKIDSQELIRLDTLSTAGKIHWFFVLGLILIVPITLPLLIKEMWRNTNWKSMALYTTTILVINLIAGLLWYLLVSNGSLNEGKGLIQKLLATNVLIWLVVVGRRLWMLDSEQQ